LCSFFFCAGSEAVVAVDPACTGLAAKPLCLAYDQGIWKQQILNPQGLKGLGTQCNKASFVVSQNGVLSAGWWFQ